MRRDRTDWALSASRGIAQRRAVLDMVELICIQAYRSFKI